MNAKLVCNNAILIYDLIVEEKAELACIIESWMGEEGWVLLSEICLGGFHVWPKSQGRGSRVVVIVWDPWQTFRGLAPQIVGCGMLFLKLGTRRGLLDC